MQTVVVESKEQSLVEVSGRISIDSSSEFRSLLLREIERAECRTLIVDLHDVSHLDTSGIAVLLEGLKRAMQQEKQIEIRGLRDRPRFVMEATGILRLFQEVER